MNVVLLGYFATTSQRAPLHEVDYTCIWWRRHGMIVLEQFDRVYTYPALPKNSREYTPTDSEWVWDCRLAGWDLMPMVNSGDMTSRWQRLTNGAIRVNIQETGE